MAQGGRLSAADYHPRELPALVLAYLGDAVWEAYVRRRLIDDAGFAVTAGSLHRSALRRVSAAAQASMLKPFEDKLTEEELSILKRGRRSRAKRSRTPSSMSEHRNSTGFEALLGYLELCGSRQRLEELMDLAYRLENDYEG